jgi:hypothetical protein
LRHCVIASLRKIVNYRSAGAVVRLIATSKKNATHGNVGGMSHQCTVCVLQPGYLPWIGYFDQLSRADAFVHYDDVQYDKHGWRNRNRIKTIDGQALWLTVPVITRGLAQPLIREVAIDNRLPWARKHIGSLRQAYAKAPFVARYLPAIEDLLQQTWHHLSDLNLAVTQLIASWLGIQTRTVRASNLGITGDRSERLLKICHSFQATHYLTGDAAQDYLDITLFQEHGVQVEWQRYRHPVYPQINGPFLSQLSTLDLLFNCGPDSLAILTGG